jgi:hypothetical protein
MKKVSATKKLPLLRLKFSLQVSLRVFRTLAAWVKLPLGKLRAQAVVFGLRLA